MEDSPHIRKKKRFAKYIHASSNSNLCHVMSKPHTKYWKIVLCFFICSVSVFIICKISRLRKKRRKRLINWNVHYFKLKCYICGFTPSIIIFLHVSIFGKRKSCLTFYSLLAKYYIFFFMLHLKVKYIALSYCSMKAPMNLTWSSKSSFQTTSNEAEDCVSASGSYHVVLTHTRTPSVQEKQKISHDLTKLSITGLYLPDFSGMTTISLIITFTFLHANRKLLICLNLVFYRN